MKKFFAVVVLVVVGLLLWFTSVRGEKAMEEVTVAPEFASATCIENYAYVRAKWDDAPADNGVTGNFKGHVWLTTKSGGTSTLAVKLIERCGLNGCTNDHYWEALIPMANLPVKTWYVDGYVTFNGFSYSFMNAKFRLDGCTAFFPKVVK